MPHGVVSAAVADDVVDDEEAVLVAEGAGCGLMLQQLMCL